MKRRKINISLILVGILLLGLWGNVFNDRGSLDNGKKGIVRAGVAEGGAGWESFKNKELLTIGEQEWLPGEFVVKFKKGVSENVIRQINQQHRTSVLSISNRGKFMRLRVPKNMTVNEIVSIYSRNPNVQYAEPNFIAYALMIPNDTYYPYQWHMDNPTYGGIHMESAWDIQTGDPGVIVAVVDTGVAYENYGIYKQAPDLAGTPFVAGYDFANNDAHPNDDNGHGTHVTGTIAQNTNNSVGVSGVAFNTSIMPVKVLDESGSGTYTAITDGIYFAADNGAKVINLSLGGLFPSATLEEAVAYASEQKGVTVVCAAGNYGDMMSLPVYPAAYEQCIAVGATRFDEARSYYSNTGIYLDLTAPGGDIEVDQNNDGYGDGVLQQTFDTNPAVFSYWFYQGTSMATPHVSGVAALLIAQGVTEPASVREALENTAEDKGPPGWDAEYGWGIVDAYAALNYSPTPVHDVAVTDILAPPWTLKGDIVPVVISVSNQGDFEESFTVTLTDTTDDHEIGQQPVSLSAKGTQNLSFLWDTALASSGDHVLSAMAAPVAEETETADNTLDAVITVLAPIHDVAVVAVDAPLEADKGDIVTVTVTVENQGTFPELVTVGLTDTTDGVPIGTPQAVLINAGDLDAIAFTWDTGTETPGDHILLAEAGAVLGETDTVDNSMNVTTTIQETPAGPVVSVSDIKIELRAKGPKYQAKATVVVVDGSLATVSDTTVTAEWTLTDTESNEKYSETVSATTNRKGKASLKSDSVKADVGDVFTITITDVIKDGYTYVPGPTTSKSVTVQ